MDTLTRRELFRRIGRAAIAGPIVLATREQQADLVYKLAMLFGPGSALRSWLSDLSLWWW